IAPPIMMLWNVRIPLGKKIALMGLFSLTVIVIAVSIVRVAVVTSRDTQADVTWLYIWSLIEMAVAVIVSCLASFRQLFVASNKPIKQAPKQKSQFTTGYQGLLATTRSQLSKISVHISSVPLKTRKIFGSTHNEPYGSSAIQSSERNIPLNSVMVDRGAEVSYTHGRGDAAYGYKDAAHETKCYV
ncbi:MAG: hypothetical protein Q9226_007866, partial [Calogaya cf. arnoldii]